MSEHVGNDSSNLQVSWSRVFDCLGSLTAGSYLWVCIYGVSKEDSTIRSQVANSARKGKNLINEKKFEEHRTK